MAGLRLKEKRRNVQKLVRQENKRSMFGKGFKQYVQRSKTLMFQWNKN